MKNKHPTRIRIIVVDDQTLVREGLASLLALTPGLEVVGTAGDGHEALALVAARSPDVVLMDVRMPGMNGVAATREIRARNPAPHVIVLTTFADDTYVFESLRAGASGYLLKSADPDHLAAAIRTVHAGGTILDPAVAQKVLRRLTESSATEPIFTERLTAREREVLRLVARGMTNAEIAADLYLAEGTVRNHVSHILEKLGARDRTHAARLAVEWGLLND
ncbi:MAG: response regulator transcription factor [Anaerolineae bacterium]|nr:response regulator transcription factor [Anaerolineae bacterium]